MNLLSIAEDVRQLFIYSESIKGSIKTSPGNNKAELKTKERAEIHLENIQAEILSLNEFLSSLAECNTEDDLNFLLESNEENYE